MTRRVREPVQVYLEAADRDLLDEITQRTGLPKAEILRRGLRQFATLTLADSPPGSSLNRIVGVLGADASIPPDLAARHDEYLYGGGPDAGPH